MSQLPLTGMRVVEFGQIISGPTAGLIFADMGADVVRIDRKGGRPTFKNDIPARGRRHVVLDLKEQNDVTVALEMIGKAATQLAVAFAAAPALVAEQPTDLAIQIECERLLHEIVSIRIFHANVSNGAESRITKRKSRV